MTTKTTDYNAQVEWRTRDDVDEDVIDALEGHSPAVSRSPYGWIEAWFTFPAGDLRKALGTAHALAGAALPGAEILTLQVMSTAEFDRRNADEAGQVEADLVSAKEAAHMLGVTGQAIRARLRNGSLPGVRDGRDWRIPRAAVETLAKKRQNADSEQLVS